MAYDGPNPYPVNAGGTGRQSLTDHAIVVGSGTAAVDFISPTATLGIPLVSTGTGTDPSFTTASVSGGGTGVTTLTSGGMLYGNAANAIGATAALTAGQAISGTGGSPFSLNRMRPGEWCNLEMSYNAGTGVFTIQGQSGTALSATNPAFVCLQSKTSGRPIVIAVTANQSFIDDNGSSEIIGNLFGHTTGRIVNQDIPFFVYGVINDAETAIQFMIARIPHYTTAPASANIGMPSTAQADLQNDFWSIDNITAADYENNPCVVLGCFRMRMSTSDDWTVQTLSSADGFGRFFEGYTFTQVAGHYSADASVYTIANGGTAAVFSGGTPTYNISKDGICTLNYSLSGDGGTDGSGAVAAQVASVFFGPNTYFGVGFLTASTGGLIFIATGIFFTSNKRAIQFANSGVYNWSAFTNGNRQISFLVTFPIQAS